MRDEKEGRKKQTKSSKQSQAKQHSTPNQGSHFSKEKWGASGGTRTHDTLHSRHSQSALPVHMYMYMLSCSNRCLAAAGSRRSSCHCWRTETRPSVTCSSVWMRGLLSWKRCTIHVHVHVYTCMYTCFNER